MSANGTEPGIQPLGARVLLKPVEQEDRTSSGIYLPDTAKEKPQLGVVIAVGDDESIKVQVNDRVFFAKYSGTEITYKGDTFLLMDVGDVLARVTN
ncbi:MAG: co-chaperone GroES [Roseiflexus sp.]